MDRRHALLQKHWGYQAFRPLQEEIIKAVEQGQDTLALLPTGGGKSLCYQLPALLRPGVCLVVSPLIALMKDQVQQLNDRRIKAACLVAGMNRQEMADVLGNALCGTLKLLYVSPERLKQRMFIEYFRKMQVGMLAVDEAHCVSQWGYDFRPPYLDVAAIRQYHPAAPLIALTATATPAVVDDIRQRLLMRNCQVFRSSFVRSNLAYRVMQGGDKVARLARLVAEAGGSSIVYTRSRRRTQEVARLLEQHGVKATCYHAGLDARERDSRQLAWMEGRALCMVATNAFGMGIDNPDVRLVVHMDLPDSLEAYFQEAGRAGRDGKPALAALLYDPADLRQLRRRFADDYPSVAQLRNVYRALCNHYRLPIGSGADTHFDFDLEEVCSHYGMDPRLVFSACRFLEREGLIALPGHEEAFATLYAPASRAELYRFRVEHLMLGEVLLAAMRLYPGLSSMPVRIDEGKLGARCGCTAAEVATHLRRMHEMKVVEYSPRPRKPQIYFLTERVDERQIYPGEERYGRVKEAALARLEAMEAYVGNARQCRSQQLVTYFGEAVVGECGQCDVCLGKADTEGRVEDAVRELLQVAPMSVADLREALSTRGFTACSDALRAMLDSGELQLDRQMFLRLQPRS